MIRSIEKKLGPNELIMPEDVQAMIASLAARQASDRLNDQEAEVRAQAQELAFTAMESSSETQARKLCRRALRLDPDCVDALLILTELDAPTMRGMIVGFERAVEAGERSLGATFIVENKGHFWLLFETRPYMRALERLAGTYASAEMLAEGIAVYEKMLELNPNDNQGARDPLLGLYLSAHNLAGAAKLLKKFEDDTMANFAWGRVLERFLAGDLAGARVALEVARTANYFVEQYLTANMRIPDGRPEMYTPGSEEEATICMDHVGMAWTREKAAMFWLLDQCVADGVRALPSKKALRNTPVTGKRLQ
jgi:tetratricopeptide (TPR) repeat protein